MKCEKQHLVMFISMCKWNNTILSNLLNVSIPFKQNGMETHKTVKCCSAEGVT